MGIISRLNHNLANNPSSGYLYRSWATALKDIMKTMAGEVDTNGYLASKNQYIIWGLLVIMAAIVIFNIITYVKNQETGYKVQKVDAQLTVLREQAAAKKDPVIVG